MTWIYQPLLPAAAQIQAGTVTTVTGYIKVWDRSQFVVKPVKYWDGSQWVQKPLKVWDGTQWVAKEYPI